MAVNYVLCIALCVLVGKIHGLNYVEIFRDDFRGNTINEAKWNRITTPSNVNQELQHYVWDDTWQEHDFLFLRSQKRNYGGRSYTSGRVDTQNKFNFLYGEVEWKAKLPRGTGIWPALWLLQWQCPPATPCTTWPPEIDVMEARGDQPNKVTTTLHYGRAPNNGDDTKEIWGIDFTADFHTYKVIWDPNQVTFFIDGREVYKITDKTHIPKEEMYLIMNVAVGGWYSGSPSNSTPFPTHFIIDYVTVHRWQ
ncbi:hypothetical protein RvY_12782 [Ramazzottius varieornatus]|uniref:GH16 domain-containing protein n=1 Tax=Ramazzottius varieornatus TaxID=947166 RepID=A0A1D1VMY6_RAMVA|nr:hypothetical protein RvY_12782 [Ramazzottius varieornatus]